MIQSSSASYDPITLFHWLWWKELCGTATPSEFQNLFEKVAAKLRPDFVKVRPYGQLGDLKCDGLFWRDGTVFQVYSPDELKQHETLAKIEEDLQGAVREWGTQLKKWVFVYNTRRGLPPDIPRMLAEQQTKYQDIVIEPLSSDALWEEMRTRLTLQQRAEILGPAAGFENIFGLPGAAPADIESLLERGRILLVHDVLSPIDVRDAASAMAPDVPFGPPVYVGPRWPTESWGMAATEQEALVTDLLRRSRDTRPRFAVFSLSPIPLAVHLGNVLSDRVDVLPFQYDRERRTWSWDENRTSYDDDILLEGIPSERVIGQVDAIVRVSLSASIGRGDTVAVAGDCPIQIDVSVADPNVAWLCHSAQLTAVERTFREVLRELNRLVPDCAKIHLFYAGPTGGAIAIGRAINPKMNPAVALYEYTRTRTPRYERVLTLGDEMPQASDS